MSHHHHHPHKHHFDYINSHPDRNANRQVLVKAVNNALDEKNELELTPTDAAGAWERLQKGNQTWEKGEISRFVQHLIHETTQEVRMKLTKEQHPYAIIVTCSDSRVVPELIFDEGIGLLFIIRVAGNVFDSASIASVEYAVSALHTPLIVLLGHQLCGAVHSTIEAVNTGKYPEGALGDLVKKIEPAVNAVKQRSGLNGDDAMNECVKENVLSSKTYLLSTSDLIKKKVESGELTIRVAEYYLDSGSVKEIA